MTDTTVGPREQVLYERQERENITVTEADIAHVQHLDGCAMCHSGETYTAILERDKGRAEKAREIFVVNIHKLQGLIGTAEENGRPLTAQQISVALARISTASARAWRG